MSVVTGRTGACAWSVVQGNITEAKVALFTAYLRDVADKIVPGQVVLDIVQDVPMPTPVQRRQIVDTLNGSPKLELVAGHALVINSMMGRGLLTAINWIVKPPFEEKLFADPMEALRWLQSRNDELCADDILSDIRSAVPEFDQFTW